MQKTGGGLSHKKLVYFSVFGIAVSASMVIAYRQIDQLVFSYFNRLSVDKYLLFING